MRINPLNNGQLNKDPNNELLKKLKELGLTSSGNVEEDLKAIKEATKKLILNGPKDANQAQPKTPQEVAIFMKKIGLTPTNSKDSDHNTIIDKLKKMLSVAKTDEEKNKVNELLNEFNVLIASIESPNNNQFNGNFTGMQQLGSLNKFFMIR